MFRNFLLDEWVIGKWVGIIVWRVSDVRLSCLAFVVGRGSWGIIVGYN